MSTSQGPAPDVPMAKKILAGAAGLAVLLILNAIIYRYLTPMSMGSETLGSSEQAYDSFYDGCVALSTLALPAFLGGLLMSRIVGASSTQVSIVTFAAAAVIGAVHCYWQVPITSMHSMGSPFMNYMIRNPIVILAFGTLGGWLGGEFASGRFTLADRETPYLPGMEED